MKKKTIVAIGLYSPGTGFTRVFETLFKHLKHTFDIHWIGIGYKGEIVNKGYKIYPNNLEGGDLYGAYFAAELANRVGAELIWLINDFWMLKNYAHTLKDLDNHVKTMAYIPLDGKIHDPSSIYGVNYLDNIILYTSFAYHQTKQALNINQIDHPDLHIIPHGVDQVTFYPMSRMKAKQKLFPNIPNLQNAVFLLNGNRYADRKAIPLTIKTFAKALPQAKKPLYLVLHQPGIEDFQLEELLDLISRYQLLKQVIINPIRGRNYVNDDQLNELYNACEIGINTSLGEGWGMVSFEHACTRAAQIVPGHTACTELWKEGGVVIPCNNDIKLDRNPFMMSQIDTDLAADALIRLVNDSEYLQSKKVAAYQTALEEKYNWSTIAGQWKELISDAMSNKTVSAPARLK